MKKNFILLLFIGISAFAQRSLTIEEATLGQYREFAPKTLVAAQWQKNSPAITYLNAHYSALMIRRPENQWAETTLVTKEELENAVKAEFPDDRFHLSIFPYHYQWKDQNTLSLEVEGQNAKYIVLYDTAQKKLKKAFPMDKGASEPLLAPNSAAVAWLNGNNIMITPTNAAAKKITNDQNPGIVNGSSNTHRQEFGIKEGMWWHPDGTQLLYYRKDQTMVADYPLIDFEQNVAQVKNIKYPMAGMKSEEVSLVIYNLKTEQSVTLKTDGPKEQFLTAVTWDPSGNSIYTGVLNREQNHLKMNQYDAVSGKLIKTLFEEKAATYVEPLHPLTFIPNTPDQFLYRTEKDGYEQLYLYNTNGKLIRKLGYQDIVVKDFLGFDTTAKNAFYTGTANNGLDRQLYQVHLKSGKTTLLTTDSGTHTGSLSDDGAFLLDQFSNISTPNSIAVINVKTKKSHTLFNADNPYTGQIELPKMEWVSITAADGKTPLNGRLIYPSDFDATKKYPVIVYVYGGPHAQLVTNKWLGGATLFDYYMAQQGYVVFTLDNRGSDSRGRDFEHSIHRQLGQNEMADQMKGIAFLKSKNFVDQDKMGIYGWSFGGFITISLLLNQNDTFKAGVAGGPVCDWKYYEVMYGERYMDTPEENPEGYKKANVIDKAHLLKGHLLVIHGAQDPVVVQQHSMQFIQACIQLHRPVDYFLYPTHEHNVLGKDRIHLNQKIAAYFDLYLKN